MNAAGIAAAARRFEPELAEQLALRSDALAEELQRSLRLVAWDREQVIGRAQSRLRRLRGQRVPPSPGAAVTVVERTAQPLESLEVVWSWLRRDRAVRLSYEPGACRVYLDLLRGVAGRLPEGALGIDADATSDASRSLAVTPAGSRIALIHRDADRELAAYVLARTCLRRCGFGPRAVHRAYLDGPVDLLRRHLTRLWVGVQIGRADDPASFAGPVTAGEAEAYLAAYEAWSNHPGVERWADGGTLLRTDDPDGVYVAPAAFGVMRPEAAGPIVGTEPPPPLVVPDLPVAGPMLVVVCGDESDNERARTLNASEGGDAIAIGGPVRDDVVRHVRGALLVERLPPGLPDPRPI